MLKTSTIIQLAFIIAAAVVVFGFVSVAKTDQARASCTALCGLRPAYAGHDRRAPDFDLPDLDGKRVKLSSFRGKVVFVAPIGQPAATVAQVAPAYGANLLMKVLVRGNLDFL